MKFTQILYKQNIGRQIKKLWYLKRECKVSDSMIEQHLSTLGIQVKDPFELIKPKKDLPRYVF